MASQPNSPVVEKLMSDVEELKKTVRFFEGHIPSLPTPTTPSFCSTHHTIPGSTLRISAKKYKLVFAWLNDTLFLASLLLTALIFFLVFCPAFLEPHVEEILEYVFKVEDNVLHLNVHACPHKASCQAMLFLANVSYWAIIAHLAAAITWCTVFIIDVIASAYEKWDVITQLPLWRRMALGDKDRRDLQVAHVLNMVCLAWSSFHLWARSDPEVPNAPTWDLQLLSLAVFTAYIVVAIASHRWHSPSLPLHNPIVHSDEKKTLVPSSDDTAPQPTAPSTEPNSKTTTPKTPNFGDRNHVSLPPATPSEKERLKKDVAVTPQRLKRLDEESLEVLERGPLPDTPTSKGGGERLCWWQVMSRVGFIIIWGRGRRFGFARCQVEGRFEL